VAEYSNYIGIINGIAGLILLPIQLFLLNRVISWVGLGNGLGRGLEPLQLGPRICGH
jgi:hypothetical protein